MAQNKELARVKEKIRALSSKTVDNGCTEAEAMAAMNMVGRLLEQYNLSMSEIELKEEACLQKDYISMFRNRGALATCAVGIGKFCDVKVWTTKNLRTLSYCYFGLESDVEMAVYLSGMIERAIEAETLKFKRTQEYKTSWSKKSATTSFKNGMANRIYQRFLEMNREKEAARAERAAANSVFESSGSRSLTVIKSNIVEEEFRNLGVRLRRQNSYKRTGDYNAFQRGQAAGNSVNLSRPVGSSGYGYAMIGH